MSFVVAVLHTLVQRRANRNANSVNLACSREIILIKVPSTTRGQDFDKNIFHINDLNVVTVGKGISQNLKRGSFTYTGEAGLTIVGKCGLKDKCGYSETRA